MSVKIDVWTIFCNDAIHGTSLVIGHTFRFCQYPGPKGEQAIYENDYPLNCCGCFGEKAACYSCCCTIL